MATQDVKEVKINFVLSDDVSKNIKNISKNIQQALSSKGLTKDLTDGLNDANKQAQNLLNTVDTIKKTKVGINDFQDLQSDVNNLNLALSTLQDKFSDIELSLRSIAGVDSKGLANLFDRLGDFGDQLKVAVQKNVTQAMNQMNQDITDSIDVQKIDKKLDSITKFKPRKNSIDKIIDTKGLKDSQKTAEEAIDEINKLQEKASDAGEVLSQMKVTDDGYQKQVNAYVKASKQAITAIEAVRKAFKEDDLTGAKSSGADLDSMEASIRSYVTNAKDSIKDLVQAQKEAAKIANQGQTTNTSGQSQKQQPAQRFRRLNKKQMQSLMGVDFEKLDTDLNNFSKDFSDFGDKASTSLGQVGTKAQTLSTQIANLKSDIKTINEKKLSGGNTTELKSALDDIIERLQNILKKYSEINTTELKGNVSGLTGSLAQLLTTPIQFTGVLSGDTKPIQIPVQPVVTEEPKNKNPKIQGTPPARGSAEYDRLLAKNPVKMPKDLVGWGVKQGQGLTQQDKKNIERLLKLSDQAVEEAWKQEKAQTQKNKKSDTKKSSKQEVQSDQKQDKSADQTSKKGTSTSSLKSRKNEDVKNDYEKYNSIKENAEYAQTAEIKDTRLANRVQKLKRDQNKNSRIYRTLEQQINQFDSVLNSDNFKVKDTRDANAKLKDTTEQVMSYKNGTAKKSLGKYQNQILDVMFSQAVKAAQGAGVSKDAIDLYRKQTGITADQGNKSWNVLKGARAEKQESLDKTSEIGQSIASKLAQASSAYADAHKTTEEKIAQLEAQLKKAKEEEQENADNLSNAKDQLKNVNQSEQPDHFNQLSQDIQWMEEESASNTDYIQGLKSSLAEAKKKKKSEDTYKERKPYEFKTTSELQQQQKDLQDEIADLKKSKDRYSDEAKKQSDSASKYSDILKSGKPITVQRPQNKIDLETEQKKKDVESARAESETLKKYRDSKKEELNDLQEQINQADEEYQKSVKNLDAYLQKRIKENQSLKESGKELTKKQKQQRAKTQNKKQDTAKSAREKLHSLQQQRDQVQEEYKKAAQDYGQAAVFEENLRDSQIQTETTLTPDDIKNRIRISQQSAKQSLQNANNVEKTLKARQNELQKLNNEISRRKTEGIQEAPARAGMQNIGPTSNTNTSGVSEEAANAGKLAQANRDATNSEGQLAESMAETEEQASKTSGTLLDLIQALATVQGGKIQGVPINVIDEQLIDNISKAVSALQEFLKLYKEVNGIAEEPTSKTDLAQDAEKASKAMSELTEEEKGAGEAGEQISVGIDQEQLGKIISSVVQLRTQLQNIAEIIEKITGITPTNTLNQMFKDAYETAQKIKDNSVDFRNGQNKELRDTLTKQWQTYLDAGGTNTLDDLGGLSKKLTDHLKKNISIPETAEGSVQDLKGGIRELINLLNTPIAESSVLASLNALSKQGGDINKIIDAAGKSKSAKTTKRQADIEAQKKATTDLLNNNYSEVYKNAQAAIQGYDNNNAGKIINTQISQTRDGLIQVTSLVETLNGEFKQLTMTSKDGLNFDFSKSEENTARIQKQLRQYQRFQAQMENIAKNSATSDDEMIISKDDVDTDTWQKLINYASQYENEIGQITKITRQVRTDNEGNALISYSIFGDKGGHVTTGKDSDIIAASQDYANIENINNIVKQLTSSVKEYYDLVSKEASGKDLTAAQAARLDILNNKYLDLIQSVKEFNAASSADKTGNNPVSNAANNALSNFITENNSDIDKIIDTRVASLQGKITNARKTKNNQGTDFTDSFKSDLSDAEQILARINEKQKAIQANGSYTESDLADIIGDLQKVQGTVSEITNKANQATKLSDIGKQLSRVSDLLNNTSVSGKTREGLQQIQQKLIALQQQAKESGEDIAQINYIDFGKMTSAITNAEGTIKALGQDTKSFSTRLGDSIKSQTANFLSQYFSIQDYIRYIREIFTNVNQVDSALIELQKVSDASNDRIQQSFRNSADTAQELGATLSDVINSTADWSRLGYSIDDAEKMAKATTLFQTVGDNMTQESASNALISTMKAYNVTADKGIDTVSKYNQVANNFSVDTAGLADAIQRSGSALSAAGNTLDQSLGLITAANDAVQNPQSVGGNAPTIKVAISVNLLLG